MLLLPIGLRNCVIEEGALAKSVEDSKGVLQSGMFVLHNLKAQICIILNIIHMDILN